LLPDDDRGPDREAIAAASAAAGCPLTQAQAEQLSRFGALLRKWNRVHNLTTIDRPQGILTHHLLDCLAVAPEVDRAISTRPRRILDVGSGAGLPGLVLAVVLPDAEVTLVDSVQKKTAFLQQAAIEMGLGNVRVLHARVEDVRAPRFEAVVSRAFAELAEMVRLTAHLLEPGGLWMAMKGTVPAGEIAALPETVALVRTVKLRVPLLDAERHLVVLRPR
jgi:16S rRNA (guanine527-N7)-methyltransferase